MGKTGTLATRPGVTWLVPLAPTQPSDARPCPLPVTALIWLGMVWRPLAVSVHYWPVSRPGLVWRLVTAPEVEVYQEVITTLQYTHFTGAQAQRNNIRVAS